MMTKIEKRRLLYSLVFPFLFVCLLWLIKLVEWHWELRFTSFGILPRKVDGLSGILFSPLIHGDFTHLFNNSVPILMLGWTLFYFYKELAPKIVWWSWILSGLYTWISARTSYHIGASGLVYALFGFLFISGFVRRSNALIAISFLVAFLYGSLVWGILPWDKSISWEGHFWGLFAGFVLAFYYRKEGPQRKIHVWEEEFDEEHSGITEANGPDELEYEYHFIPNKPTEKEEG